MKTVSSQFRTALLALCGALAFPVLAAGPAGTPKVEGFGKMPGGREVHRYVLTNNRGMSVELTDYGASILAIHVPDRKGTIADVVLGYRRLGGYLAVTNPDMGATVGRFAGRIANGRFDLDGRTYWLTRNDRGNHTNGGVRGFSRELWNGAVVPGANAVCFRHRSPEGEEGYPGRLDTSVTYRLEDDNALRIDYRAVTNRPTIVNLTNHAYFDLSGNGGGVRGQLLRVKAGAYLLQRLDGAPTGEVTTVKGTPFDFRRERLIGRWLPENPGQPGGYNHTLRLDRDRDGLVFAAELRDPASGRSLKVLTTEPGLHLYTGNYLNFAGTGKPGRSYRPYEGVCLETQHFSDAPNQPGFPSVVLKPGEEYKSTTVYAFGTR